MVMPIDWSSVYAGRAERMKASEIRELLKLLDQPDVISFAGGIPDPALFPTLAFREANEKILGDAKIAAQALQYSISEGYPPLRQWIVEHMKSMGVDCDIDNILITHGSQQALDFLGKMLISPGDTALVTAPTYLGALQAFNPYEPRYDTLAPEGNRTPLSYAEAAEREGGRVKFAYLVPDCSNPTGETLDETGRLKVLDLAENLGVPVIEDAAYRAIRFEGDAPRTIQALDCDRSGGIDACRTIFLGTFSKTLAPAYRIGWICAAKPLIQKLVLVKQASDLHTSTINQMLMFEVAEKTYDRQVEAVIETYSKRRDALLRALKTRMPKGVSWTEPNGGLFVWVTLPEKIDGAALLARAITEERVAFVPGKAFFATESKANTIRLNFSAPTEAMIEEGISRLGRLVKNELSH
ncbi:PLP-dependent aminotransferase family protein [Chthonobacter albigriseus]|uniref:aminotransferase-like domain-containing protein n=1 Tax=Chthonobacter albigriseus TaxID=1683161 RepID=UPI001FCF28F8|nr:PLP-dependent aminotransferase family protein [Chthonobacter albigriseus]